VELADSSTDHLTIRAELPHAALLLITDSYSAGWRATPLPGSIQRSYQVLPANYVLRAIPLAAGSHRLRLEYAPLAFRAGVWVSLASLIVYLMFCGWWIRQAALKRWAHAATDPAQKRT
jgi:uncharacterized membrane protein YfhO